MSYSAKYGGIVKKLVRKSFPSLREEKIILIEIPDINRFNAFAFDFYSLKIIFIYRKARAYSDKALIGLFAHELSHFERYKIMKKQRVNLSLLELKYLFSKEKRISEERETNVLAFKKGYKKEILQLIKEISKNLSPKQYKKWKQVYLPEKNPSEINKHGKKKI